MASIAPTIDIPKLIDENKISRFQILISSWRA